jgi:hypothetical protein
VVNFVFGFVVLFAVVVAGVWYGNLAPEAREALRCRVPVGLMTPQDIQECVASQIQAELEKLTVKTIPAVQTVPAARSRGR